ncbi:MAG TPA: PEPxxWA-CTERM sorting domain-containing protein [Phenylobacterium sp.]|nr:PEPxxWA-CTERM sorting domain-containing protein [Phenylobacterium sp.]
MRRLATLAAAATALLLASGAARANTITLNETVDLTAPQSPTGSFFGWRDFTDTGGAFSPDFSFDLSAGDTLDYTADFLGNQTVTLVNPSLIWLLSSATDGGATGVNGTGSLDLLDAVGNVLYSSTVKTDDEGSVHFGQFFDPSDFSALPTTITIGGLHYVGTLNSYDDPSITVRTYADPQVLFSVDSATVSTGVPEPLTWALMVAGFGLAGAVLRRRRAQPALT